MFQKHTHNLRKYMYKFLFCFVLLFIRNEDTFIIIIFSVSVTKAPGNKTL